MSLRSVRWMAVPIAAYLLITLVFPIANGAATRASFVPHAAWVLGGCIAAVAVAMIGGSIVELVRTNLWRKR